MVTIKQPACGLSPQAGVVLLVQNYQKQAKNKKFG